MTGAGQMNDRELAAAKARWGETFELKCLEGSRDDTRTQRGTRVPRAIPAAAAGHCRPR